MRKRLILMLVLLLPLFSLATGPGFGRAVKSPVSAPKTELEIIKGTIDFNERLGGYFIRGQEPGGEFFIVNQNPSVLKKLKESGRTVTIKGRTADQGAEYFFIQLIDGKKYSAPEAGPKEEGTSEMKTPWKPSLAG